MIKQPASHGQEYLIVPVGDGGEAPCRRLRVSRCGMLMVSGFMAVAGDIFSGESSISAESMNSSDSSISDWKYNRMLVLGKRMEQLENNKSLEH